MDRDIHPLLGYNINVISHFIQNVFNEKLSDYGLTYSQAKVIYFLANHGEQSQTELQNRLYIKASSMNGIIESLLKNECITKQICPNDKRSKLIKLTDKGVQLDETIWTIAQNIENEISLGLAEKDQQVMISCLQKIQNNLKHLKERS
ncbi:MarR family winged helix-turn-helix transcriptional regulator [Halobacillus naozhouensis]|uniref:MarR family transcriptional regulator n=1 Tax=Halobacillus naozhouensis TaxID=554880 RepID=A0ABY8IZL6_9BACI|nr:MarR family transcriptional regulator [Halobacillus naozhouensis]WFT75247.1 MarR family transcriptional regulator [Halobacillus naozhouensis]